MRVDLRTLSAGVSRARPDPLPDRKAASPIQLLTASLVSGLALCSFTRRLPHGTPIVPDQTSPRTATGETGEVLTLPLDGEVLPRVLGQEPFNLKADVDTF